MVCPTATPARAAAARAGITRVSSGSRRGRRAAAPVARWRRRQSFSRIAGWWGSTRTAPAIATARRRSEPLPRRGDSRRRRTFTPVASLMRRQPLTRRADCWCRWSFASITRRGWGQPFTSIARRRWRQSLARAFGFLLWLVHGVLGCWCTTNGLRNSGGYGVAGGLGPNAARRARYAARFPTSPSESAAASRSARLAGRYAT